MVYLAVMKREGPHESCAHERCWREGRGILGWASLFSTLVKMLPSKFITYQRVGWVGEAEDVPIIRKPSRSIVLTLRDIIKEGKREKKSHSLSTFVFKQYRKRSCLKCIDWKVFSHQHIVTNVPCSHVPACHFQMWFLCSCRKEFV